MLIFLSQFGYNINIISKKYGTMKLVRCMNIERLKEIRKDRDYTQKEIAAVLKINQVKYSRYETGARVIPVDKLILLANFYGVSLDYLLSLTNQRKPYPRN